MTAGTRLREQLERVGRAKAAGSAEDIAEHLARSPGERLERVVRQSDTLSALFRQAGKAGSPVDDSEVWLRVFRRLHPSLPDG